MSKTSSFALLGFLFSIAGCFPTSGPVPPPISTDAATVAASKWPGTTPATLASGRDTFVRHCNNCHGYPDVQAVDEKSWPSIVEKMGHKAKLSPPETASVLQFVLASRANGAP
jgi:mono/diheme cytochrome c family protein